MHVNLVTHELLIFAPFAVCPNIVSIELLLKKFIRYRTHIDAGMPRPSENERNQAFEMFMVRASKQHVANTFCCSVSIVTRL